MTGTRRVHEIAKELNRNSKDLLEILRRLNIDAKGANSVVTPDDEAKLRAHLFGIKEKRPEAPEAAAPGVPGPSLAGARLRKKAARPAEAEPTTSAATAAVAADATPAGGEAPPAEPAAAAVVEEAGEVKEVPAGKGAQAAEKKAAAPASVEEKKEKPKTEEKAGATAETPGRKEKALPLGKTPKPKKAAPKPERPGAPEAIIEEIEPERALSLSPEALRRLARAGSLARARSQRARGKKAAPERAAGARRAIPEAIRSKSGKPRPAGPSVPKPVVKKKIRFQGDNTLGELALLLDVSTEKLQAYFDETGRRGTIPLTVLTAEEQAAAASALGWDVTAEPRVPRLAARMPVVAVLGHVDHGKTTLLDAIRKTNVVATESGGITQHIGASVVAGKWGNVVFIDTPGHEIFTHMRARGAQVTDIVVLVVAADDGAMPQTLESISHAKAARVPIVVAITKMDKAEADPLRVKKGLAEHGVTTEDWGGDVLAVEVAAPNGRGLDKLLEAISLQAEIMELKGDLSARTQGVVLESTVDRGRGPVMTVLVRRGALRVGDSFIVGARAGRVRALFDTAGKSVKEAGPSVPVSVLGAESVPAAGDVFVGIPNDKTARTLAAMLVVESPKEAEPEAAFTLDEWYKQMQEGGKNELNLVVKADVAGSREALVERLGRLGDEEVSAKVIHSAVGAVNEGDVLLAGASQAVVIAFRVGVEPKAKQLAQREGVEIRPYDVVYEVMEDIRAALEGMLEPAIVTDVIGSAEVRQIFETSGGGRVAGSMVRTGRVTRGAKARVLRGDEVVYEGSVSSLRRFRDDVKEVQQGYECGIQVTGFNDFEPGDRIEALEERKVARRLSVK